MKCTVPVTLYELTAIENLSNFVHSFLRCRFLTLTSQSVNITTNLLNQVLIIFMSGDSRLYVLWKIFWAVMDVFVLGYHITHWVMLSSLRISERLQ